MHQPYICTLTVLPIVLENVKANLKFKRFGNIFLMQHVLFY